MSTLWFAINAIFPIFILIGLGYLLARLKFYDDAFLSTLNKYVYFIGLPVLLFYNVYNIDSIFAMNFDIVWIATIAGSMLFILGWVVAVFFVEQKNRKGVVSQAIFRSNFAIIGLPLATALGGVESTAVASVLSAFMIPLFNILAIVALSMFMNDGQKINKRHLVFNVIKNPLSVGVFFGFAVLLIRKFLTFGETEAIFMVERDIPFIYDSIKMIAVTASPIALIALGGQFKFKALKNMIKDVIIGVVGRLVIAPVIGFSSLFIVAFLMPDFSVNNAYIPGMIALFASPAAVSSVVMAAQLDGDDILASQLVVWTSVFSIFTIFTIIVAFKGFGYL